MREHSQVHDAGTSEHGFQPAAQPAPAESCTDLGFEDDGVPAYAPLIVFLLTLAFTVALWALSYLVVRLAFNSVGYGASDLLDAAPHNVPA